MLLGEHEKNGAKVYTNKTTKNLQFKGDTSGNISSVVFESGFEIPADMVIFGGGVNLNTQMAVDSGLTMDKNGGVFVNPFM